MGEMLAAAEADFEPQPRGHRAERRGKIERRADFAGRETVFEQGGLPGTQLAPAPPAVGMERAPGEFPRRPIRFVRFGSAQRAPKADFRSATRSVFSQEKPPSFSGLRPKWP